MSRRARRLTLPPPDPDTAWEHQPDEPPIAFHAFTHYRDLGPTRSVDKAWKAHITTCLHRPQPPSRKRAEDPWFDWSALYAWKDRAALYDQHLDRLATERLAKDRVEAKVRHAKQAALIQGVLTLPARAILGVLQDPHVMQSLIEEARTDPRKLLQLVNMAAWAARSYPGLVEVEREALGLTLDDEGTEDTMAHDYARDYGDLIVASPVLTDLALTFLHQLTARAGARPALGPRGAGGPDGDGGTVADGPASGLPDEDPD